MAQVSIRDQSTKFESADHFQSEFAAADCQEALVRFSTSTFHKDMLGFILCSCIVKNMLTIICAVINQIIIICAQMCTCKTQLEPDPFMQKVGQCA